MRIVETTDAPAAIGPYSQAVIAGGFVFCSGQIPLKDGQIVGDSSAEQARLVLQNLDAVLHAAGCRREDVAKTTIFLTDLSAFADVNAVYAEFFGAHAPARATVEVSALPKGERVEIEAIAVRPGGAE